MKSCVIVFIALSSVVRATAEEPAAVRNWPAAPYWTPPARDAARSGREPLRGQTVAASPLPFFALSPCRIVDTRGGAPLGGGYLPASAPRSYTLTGQCGLPAGAAATSLNVTVTATEGPGYVSIWPRGGAQPVVSTLNYVTGQTIANAAIVPLSADGGVTVACMNAGCDMIVDTNGYYAAQVSVTTLNTLTGDVTLAPGANISITPSGNALTIAAAAAGGPPSGAAGGSLSGTYPDPAIAGGAVGPSQLANATAVRSINGAAQDLVTLQGTGGVAISTAGSTITIGAPSGSMVLGAPGDTTLIAAGYTEMAPTPIQYWTATALAGAPPARADHKAVWTGSRMIVWGGTSNDGGQYDPVVNAWTATTTTGAPSARAFNSAVWTGSRMVIWGGYNGVSCLNDGGRYDPVADAWTPTTTVGAPSARGAHTAVWIGSRMIVWSGWINTAPSYVNDGGKYDPVADVWWGVNLSDGAPSGREAHTAVWDGGQMIVWGGQNSSGLLNDGGQYNPATFLWTATSPSAAPSPRSHHSAVWTGSRMIVWGGSASGGAVNDGGQYDPTADTWTATSTVAAPPARAGHTAVWTGSRMVVWGGNGISDVLNDGGLYDPIANTWGPVMTTGAPSARSSHTAVWTGSRMIIWGGYDGGYLNTGGQWRTVSLYMKN